MLCSTKFNVKKFLRDVLIVLVCCKCISEKAVTFALYITDWFCMTEVERVYYAIHTESIYVKRTRFVFKGNIVLKCKEKIFLFRRNTSLHCTIFVRVKN